MATQPQKNFAELQRLHDYFMGLNDHQKADFAKAVGANSAVGFASSIKKMQMSFDRARLIELHTNGLFSRVGFYGDYAYEMWADIPKPCAKFPPPKDGTRIDLFFRDVGRVTNCYWFEDLWEEGEWREDIKCWKSDSNESWQSEEEPTHWLPIPTPPKDAP
jgi:hypothetical protein